MSSGLGEALGEAMARTFVAVGCLCLVVGLVGGVLVTKACSAGWRLASPIQRTK